MSRTVVCDCGRQWDSTQTANCPACGGAFPPEQMNTVADAPVGEQPLLPQGTRLKERYALQSVLGQGGMGVVYLGSDELLRRPVAVKMIRPRDPALRERTMYQDGLREAFLDEARLGAQLLHPAISTVFDFGFHDGQPFTVFEYIPGETLRELIERRGPLPLEDARLILAPLAQALDFAHGQGVVHRDLKPENVRATAQGNFKVLDLGLARQFRQDLDWRFAGTPAYASPEQARGLPCDGRTDQYALALIAFELLTGQRPFQGRDVRECLEQHAETAPPDPRSLRPELPESVSRALLRALAKDPGERFRSCEAFAVALGCALLSAEAAPPRLLRVARLKRLKGVSRWSWLQAPGRPAPHVALDAEALWTWDDGEMRRWPLAGLRKVKTSRRRLRLSFTGIEQPLLLSFGRAEECEEWADEIDSLRRDTPAAREGQGAERRPVILLERRPPGRYQALGPVEHENATRATAQVGLQFEAALLGADAVLEMTAETVVYPGKTVRRLAGTAVRAVDEAGRRELHVRWLEDRVRRFCWPLSVFVVYFCILMALSAAITAAMEPGKGLRVPSWGQIGLTTAAFLFIVGVPALMTLLLRWLRWPQLLPPTLAVVGACGLIVIAGFVGSALAAWQQGISHWFQALMLFSIFDPTALVLLAGSGFLVWQGLRLHRQSRSLLGSQRARGSRRPSIVAAWTLAIVFAAVVLGGGAWQNYLLHGRLNRGLVFDRHRYEAASAEALGDEALRQGDLAEARKQYSLAGIHWELALEENGLSVEDKLVLARCKEKEASVFDRKDQQGIAEMLWQEILELLQKLAEDHPDRADVQQALQRVRRTHGRLYCLRQYESTRRLVDQVLLPQQATFGGRRGIYQQALAQCRSLREGHPEAMASPELAAARGWEAECQRGLAIELSHAEAEPLLRLALATQERMVREAAGDAERRTALARTETRLAWCLLMRNPKDVSAFDALELAQRGVAGNRGDGHAWLVLAAVYAHRGDWRQCRANLEEARQRRGEGDPYDWLLWAQVHGAAGDVPKAREQLKRAQDWLDDLNAETILRRFNRRERLLWLTCSQPLEVVTLLRLAQPVIALFPPPPPLRVPAHPLHNVEGATTQTQIQELQRMLTETEKSLPGE